MKDLFGETFPVSNNKSELVDYGGPNGKTKQVFHLLNLPEDTCILRSDFDESNHMHYSPLFKSGLSNVFNIADFLVVIPSKRTFIAIELKYTKDNKLPEYEPQIKGALLLSSQIDNISYFKDLLPGSNIEKSSFKFLPLVVHHHPKLGLSTKSDINLAQKMKLDYKTKYGMKVFISNNSHIDIEQFLQQQKSVCDISFAHYQ